MVFRSGSETVAVAGLDLLGYPAVLGDRARGWSRAWAPRAF